VKQACFGAFPFAAAADNEAWLRLNSLFVRLSFSDGYRASAIIQSFTEVKTSRADFLCELKQPWKRRIGLRYSNEFYFVTLPDC
jgi:hypothetical protein